MKIGHSVGRGPDLVGWSIVDISNDDRGLLVEGGLPNLARIAFEDAGLLAPTRYLIEAGQDPTSESRSGRLLTLFGIALFGIGTTIPLVRNARPA